MSTGTCVGRKFASADYTFSYTSNIHREIVGASYSRSFSALDRAISLGLVCAWGSGAPWACIRLLTLCCAGNTMERIRARGAMLPATAPVGCLSVREPTHSQKERRKTRVKKSGTANYKRGRKDPRIERERWSQMIHYSSGRGKLEMDSTFSWAWHR